MHAINYMISRNYKPNCIYYCVIGKRRCVHISVFQGTLESGTVFDTSKQPNRGPLPFKLGEGKVIPGKLCINLNSARTGS